MSKEELEEVFHIQKEIQQLERSIERLERQTQMTSDVVQNGYKRHAVIYGIDVKRAYKLQSYYEKLRKFKITLLEKQKEIEDYIEKIQFSEIRQIFRLRYIEGMNWIQASHEMNRNYNKENYTENSIRHKHDRYIEKNK